MAKLIYNGQEIADVTYTSGGGGGSGLPTFTETVIATGTSGGTVTFTDDYEDYPLLVIRITNSSSNNVTDLLVSPNLLDSIFGVANFVVNEFGNNQYANYEKTSSTIWTRTASRNIYISEIIGLTCDNMTVTETEIYNKGSYDTQSRTISGTDLLDYDLFVIASSVDGVQPNSIITQKPIVVVDYKYLIFVTPYYRSQLVTITDTEMSSAPYHYVGGIKFS